MNNFLKLSVILFLLALGGNAHVDAQTVQAGIFNVPSGNSLISVKAKPSGTVNGIFSGVNVTIRWLTLYNITLTVTSTSYSITPQGPVGIDGLYSYQTYGAIPNVSINWAANSENELFIVRVDGGVLTGTFELTNTPPPTTAWYFELNGSEITNSAVPFYQQSASGVSLPVQLVSFTASALNNNRVQLDWRTISEINNYGFEIQKRRNTDPEFQTLPNSFIPGHGTTNEPHNYSFTDSTATQGNWQYRLKQIDLDGTIHFTDAVRVNVLTGVEEKPLPTAFALNQNYPNPFNPTTSITYDLPRSSYVRLTIFDMLGREIATLVDGVREAGRYETELDATTLASGIYMYRLEARQTEGGQAGAFVATKKLVLLR